MCHSGSVLTFHVTPPHIVPGASLSKAQPTGPSPSLSVSGGVEVKTAALAPDAGAKTVTSKEMTTDTEQLLLLKVTDSI